jgi:acyl carrier protein
VGEAIVIARQDTPGDQRLVAYLVPHDGAELSPASLRTELAAVLPEYMVPAAYVMLDAFPLTPNGKLDRQALPAPDHTAVLTRSYAPPEGETEMAIALIWQELLGLERIGRHDHFFELGGHSLLAVQLLIRLQEKFEMDISIKNLFTQPVLSDLAEMLVSLQLECFSTQDIQDISHEFSTMSESQLRAMLAAENTSHQPN